MASIGDLNIKVRADSSPLRNDLRQAGRSVGGFRSSIGGLAASFLPAATAAGALAIAVKAFRGFQQIAKDIDSVAKSARLLGVELRELEGLKFAGGLAGVDPSKVIGGLKTMQKRIGEAARGSGAAVPALAELGLDAKDLVSQDAIDSLVDIADAFDGIEEPARRAAIASNIFSKGNMEMLLLVGQGGEAVRAQVDNMKNLSSITGDNAAQFELFNDRIATTGMLWDEFKKGTAAGFLDLLNIFVGLHPALELVQSQLDKAGGLSENLGDELDDIKAIGAFEDLSEDAEVAAEAIGKIADASRDAARSLLGSLTGKLDALAGSDDIDAMVKNVLTDAWMNLPTDEFVKFSQAIHAIADDLKLAKQRAKELGGATQKAASADDFIKGLEDAIALETGLSPDELKIRDLREQGMDPWKVDQAKDLVKELEQARKVTADIELGESFTERFRTPLEEFVKVAEDLDQLLDIDAIDKGTAQRAFAAAEEDLAGRAGSATTPEIFTGRAELGSAEAYRIIARAQAGGAAISPQDKILAEGKKQTRHLSNLEDALEKGVEKLDPPEVAEVPP